MNINQAIIAVSGELISGNEVKRATKYLSDKVVVKATRRGTPRKGSNLEMVLTVGKPNFKERNFIKACKKANESFPVKKIQLSFIKKGK
jgi:hypothetical protein